jgi:hypothetical protein
MLDPVYGRDIQAFVKNKKGVGGGSPPKQGGARPGKSMTYSRCGAWCGAEVVDLVGLGAETGGRRARGCALPLSLGVKNSHIHNSHIHNNLYIHVSHL